jgi:hypothetical protein
LVRVVLQRRKKKIVNLVREYKDVFAWSYDELKAYDPKIINHAIPLLEGAKPFRQRLRFMNPKVAPTIQKELQKLYEARIIEPIRYSHWVANCVPFRKKSGVKRVFPPRGWVGRICGDAPDLLPISGWVNLENAPLTQS